MATIIKTNGQKIIIHPQNIDVGFRQDELKRIVGGNARTLYIKTPAKQKRVMVVRDEVDMHELQINRRATNMFRNCRHYPCDDVVLGDVLIAQVVTECDDQPAHIT